jgi:hypothetical protein
MYSNNHICYLIIISHICVIAVPQIASSIQYELQFNTKQEATTQGLKEESMIWPNEEDPQ